jgi:hypothetical protein
MGSDGPYTPRIFRMYHSVQYVEAGHSRTVYIPHRLFYPLLYSFLLLDLDFSLVTTAIRLR